MTETKPPVEIFYCYSRKDEKLRAKLDGHLSSLRRSDLAHRWYDQEIPPGADWRAQIDRHLDSADLILLLVSADFITSEFCYSVEMKRAIERHEKGEARVIPVILRPVDWESTPFGKLQSLPSGCPITDSRNRDKAFKNVALAIRKVVNDIIAKRESSPAKRAILAIEDDPGVMDGYVAYLEDEYRILEAKTGAEGKRRLLAESPDLIILDLGLPDMSGEEWLDWYMALGYRIPIIVASGAGTILKATKSNALTAAISKPFEMKELVELIETLLLSGKRH